MLSNSPNLRLRPRRPLMRGAAAAPLAGLLLAQALAGVPLASRLLVLEPVTQDGQMSLLPGPQGGAAAAPLLRRMLGPLAALLAREATGGITAFVLALDARAQRIAGAARTQPTVLLVSEEEGGFARRGFWLQRPGGQPEWHPEPYVNLVVDEESIRSGEFEEIFAHELGHVLLRRLLPRLPQGYSRVPHSSLAVTDYPTAFDEGFAIHFQALARRLSTNPALRARDAGLPFQPFLGYWKDATDGALRIAGVRGDLFVQRQLAPADEEYAENPDATTLFDPTQLKSAQQMMASEGVIATLFYHLLDEDAQRPALRARYRELLLSLHALNDTALSPGTPPFLQLTEQHLRSFPALRSRWLKRLVQLTYGATVDPELARSSESLARLGRQGDAGAFIAALQGARATLDRCVARLEQDPAPLGAAVGPELWVALPPKSGGLLRPVNLNTAERGALRAWLGFDEALTQRVLGSRRSAGPFADLSDFARRSAASDQQVLQLKAGAEALQAAGPFARE